MMKNWTKTIRKIKESMQKKAKESVPLQVERRLTEENDDHRYQISARKFRGGQELTRNGCLCAGQIVLPPSPPGTHGDITFWGVVPVSLSLYFYLAPPYINTLINFFSSAPPFFHFISQCPVLFYHANFSLTPGLPGGRGRWGAGAEQFDRHTIPG